LKLENLKTRKEEIKMKNLKRLSVSVIGICLMMSLTAFNANSQSNSSNNDDGVYFSPKNDPNKGSQPAQQGGNYNNSQPASGGGMDTTGGKMNNGNAVDQNGNGNIYNNYYDEDDYGYTANLRRYYEPCYGAGYYDPWYSYPYYYGAGFYCGGYWGLGIGFYNPYCWGGFGYGWGCGGYGWGWGGYGWGHGYGYGGYGYGRGGYYSPRSSYASNGIRRDEAGNINGGGGIRNNTQSVERYNNNSYTNQSRSSARSDGMMASASRNTVSAVNGSENVASARAHVSSNAASNVGQRAGGNVTNVPLRSSNQGQRNNGNVNGNRQGSNNAARSNGNANSGNRSQMNGQSRGNSQGAYNSRYGSHYSPNSSSRVSAPSNSRGSAPSGGGGMRSSGGGSSSGGGHSSGGGGGHSGGGGGGHR
jgi:hypothetical protein